MSIKLGLIGHPLLKSKSPVIYNHWAEKYGVEIDYNLIDFPENKIDKNIKNLVDQNYIGFNVTIPYKEKIISYCESIDDNAKAIGAVNMVHIVDGKLYGYNTDCFGFTENLKQNYSDHLKGKNALVLGAGGAARAALYGLAQEGFSKIYLVNRTRARAENLAQLSNKIIVKEWSDRSNLLSDIDLLVNTTALGMIGQDLLDIDLAQLPQQSCVYDIVYKPLMTDLLKAADKAGNQIITGIGMLLHQAQPAFEKWTGIKAEIDDDLQQKVLS